MGVSDEQLVRNVSKRIVRDVKSVGSIVWPPTVDEMEEAEELYLRYMENQELICPPNHYL